jgi:hypothetical protein
VRDWGDDDEYLDPLARARRQTVRWQRAFLALVVISILTLVLVGALLRMLARPEVTP